VRAAALLLAPALGALAAACATRSAPPGAPPSGGAGAGTPSGGGTAAAAGPEQDVAGARAAMDAWLADLDAGRFPALWAATAARVKGHVDEARFRSLLEEARRPLGAVHGRTIDGGTFASARGAGAEPAGGAIVELRITTAFDGAARADEHVTVERQPDGRWRVAGYQVRARCESAVTGPSALPPPPAQLGLSAFYAKYLDADGIPVVASARARDEAVAAARVIVLRMLRKRPDARDHLVRARIRVAVLAPDEQTLDVPEHADLRGTPTDTPGVDWNDRARGLGATLQRPVTSCGEENLLGMLCDRYAGESTLMHELGHTIAQVGLEADEAFQRDLDAAYHAAVAAGRWKGTYAGRDVDEYWAEGVQDWFDANLTGGPEHNEVHTRAQLATYDPALRALLARVFEDDDWRFSPAAAARASLAELVAQGVAPARRPETPLPAPAACPPGMAALPGRDGAPGVRVEPFCMDVHEVTAGEYGACARAGRCSRAWTSLSVTGVAEAKLAAAAAQCNGARADRRDHPINCVDWDQATAYCRAQGKRLPTEDEWEWAARGGPDNRPYPWGTAAPGAQLCWSGQTPLEHTCPVGVFAAGDAPHGLHDLAGNVWEWTSSTALGEHVQKGGGFNATAPAWVGVSARDGSSASARTHTLGFRCVK
jgi:hypothetical protein